MSTEKVTDELLKELESKHQRVCHLRGRDGGWEVVFRRPTRQEYKRFKASMHNPQLAPDAQEQLARQCVVHPSKEAFDALLEDFPAIPEAASEAFSRLMGLAVEADTK